MPTGPTSQSDHLGVICAGLPSVTERLSTCNKGRSAVIWSRNGIVGVLESKRRCNYRKVWLSCRENSLAVMEIVLLWPFGHVTRG